jgi:HEAT repeat protein
MFQATKKSLVVWLSIASLCQLISGPICRNVLAQGKHTVPELIQFLKDDNLATRESAAKDLEALGPEAKVALPALIDALNDSSDYVRKYAVKAIGNIGPEAKEAVPDLVNAFGDKSGPVVTNSAEAVAKIGPSAVPALTTALNNRNGKVRWVAAYAIGKIGPQAKTAVPALIDALQDNFSLVRQYSAGALGKIGPQAKTAVPALIDALKDENEIRWNAEESLEEIGPSAVPALVEALKNDYYSDVRSTIVKVLGKFGMEASPAVPALTAALVDKDRDVRYYAKKALGNAGPSAVPVLLEALENEYYKDVREIIVFIIGKSGPEAWPAISALTAALEDKDEDVREYAAEALGKIGPRAKAAVPALIDALRNMRPGAANALGNIGPSAVPALILALEDEKKQVRKDAAYSLSIVGPEAKAAVPALIDALNNWPFDIRLYAAVALGNIGPEAKAAVPALIEALKTKVTYVRKYIVTALGKIGPEAKAAVPALIQAIKYKDITPESAEDALIKIGPSGVPALVEAIENDYYADVRSILVKIIGEFGPKANSAVPALAAALKDEDESVRSLAAYSLGNIGLEAKAAVPVLTEVLEDKSTIVREKAAFALGKIGLAAESSIPALTTALRDKDESVRSQAAVAIANIANLLRDNRKKDRMNELRNAKNVLFIDPKFKKEATSVRRALEYLEKIEPPWWQDVLKWAFENLLISSLILVYILWVIGWLIIFWIKPLYVLHINRALMPYDFKLPDKLGAIKLPLRFLLFVGFLNYRSRILDAWVKAKISTFRERFFERRTVYDRQIHISVPVELDRQTFPDLTPKHMRPTFARKIGCLLIWGEGGSGKTSLACQISKWAMTEDKDTRLCEHLMLPVLIEHEFSSLGDQSAFIRAVGRQLQDLIDQANPIPEELLERLLRQRRILVIADHLSEMSEETRKLIDPGQKGFPVNALIVTSRLEEVLGGVTKTLIKPLRIRRDRLSPFMEAYLTHRGKSDLFTDSEFYDACRRLTAMVGDRDITLLLAKLYAEQLIASKEGVDDEKMPNNIPDLMLSYLNELNRNVPEENRLENPTIHRYAKRLAWESLKETFRPAPVQVDDAVTILTEENAKNHIDYLKDRLLLIKTEQPAEDRFSFPLDPLAEYIAGLHIIDLYGDNEESWKNFLAEADQKQGAPQTIKDFLLAVRDCILAKGEEAKVPDFVTYELTKRTSFNVEGNAGVVPQ